MKKLFALMFVVALSLNVFASTPPVDIYPDWDWNGVAWVYVGDGDPIDTPPTRIG